MNTNGQPRNFARPVPEFMKGYTVKPQTAPKPAAPNRADIVAAQEAEDTQLFAALAREVETFVKGTTALLAVLVRVLDTDAWTRHAAEGQPAKAEFSSFRAWAKAYLTGKGIADSLAATLASQAEGAYHVSTLEPSTTGKVVRWESLTQSVLANIGRAADPYAAAAAVTEAAADAPKGKRIGGNVWAEAMKIAPTACTARGPRTSSKSHAQKIVDRVMTLTNNDRTAARAILVAAIGLLEAEEKKAK